MKFLPFVLATLVIVRMLFHAVYLPVFEGPDEPFHLALASQIQEDGLIAVFHSQRVNSGIASAIRTHPCCDDLRRVFGCSPFSGHGAFNILKTVNPTRKHEAVDNYEAHQPPFYYVVGAGMLALGRRFGSSSPISDLLILRLTSVLFVQIAFIFLFSCFSGNRSVLLAIPSFLLLPGAAESLSRCANDSMVFLWASVLCWAVRKCPKTSFIVVLVGLGPFIKLTALPVSLFGTVWLFLNRRIWGGAGAVLSSSSIFALQYLRGWSWGGTVELNAAPATLNESFVQTTIGFVRTVYTFLKTTWWLGGWSFFRAPTFLVGVSLLIILFWAAILKRPWMRRTLIPHLCAMAALITAFTLFAFKHRFYFGTWGGVGGWYAWGWFPYLCLVVDETFAVKPKPALILKLVAVVFLVVSNLLWFIDASRLYGF